MPYQNLSQSRIPPELERCDVPRTTANICKRGVVAVPEVASSRPSNDLSITVTGSVDLGNKPDVFCQIIQHASCISVIVLELERVGLTAVTATLAHYDGITVAFVSRPLPGLCEYAVSNTLLTCTAVPEARSRR